MKTFLKTILLLSISTMISKAQINLPYLNSVELKCTIELDTAIDVFYFKYSIRNDKENKGSIDWFEIDVSQDSLALKLDDKLLTFKNERIETSYRTAYSKMIGRVVPIGFPLLPKFGEATLSVRGTAVLSASVVKPGGEMGGFIISSRGFPALRKFIATPVFDPSDYYPSFDDVANPDSLVDQIEKDRKAIEYFGFTIGPMASSTRFDITDWIDSLISYKHQAQFLGWIDNEGIANSLDQKLDNARNALMKNDKTSAKNILIAFVNEVEAQKDKHLSSEAYALLKFNAEYLISKL